MRITFVALAFAVGSLPVAAADAQIAARDYYQQAVRCLASNPNAGGMAGARTTGLPAWRATQISVAVGEARGAVLAAAAIVGISQQQVEADLRRAAESPDVIRAKANPGSGARLEMCRGLAPS